MGRHGRVGGRSPGLPCSRLELGQRPTCIVRSHHLHPAPCSPISVSSSASVSPVWLGTLMAGTVLARAGHRLGIDVCHLPFTPRSGPMGQTVFPPPYTCGSRRSGGLSGPPKVKRPCHCLPSPVAFTACTCGRRLARLPYIVPGCFWSMSCLPWPGELPCGPLWHTLGVLWIPTSVFG